MLEVKIEELTKAVIALTELIGKIEAGKKSSVEYVACPPMPAKAEKPAPVAVPEVIENVPAPLGTCPFTDGKGLIDYVMTAYKEMGPEKGAKIQGVLSEMGLQNVNELRPTEYAAFYSKVEALK